ncbi:MAG TPA: hypothetical protein VIL35_02490 [Vicinamibacterales bacterium]
MSYRRNWMRDLPHELEHVVEQLEGAYPRLLAAADSTRAWPVGPHAFETIRARTVGERAKGEVRRYCAAIRRAHLPGFGAACPAP